MALTRRGFLEASAATAVGTLWTTGERAAPPDFPAGVPVRREAYRNWAGEIQAEGVWTCTPRDAADVLAVTNWAYRNGYRVRARGYRHTWAPLTVPADGAADRTVLVDTTRHLTSMAVLATAPAAVRVQTGASMDDLLAFLEEHGLGVTNTPAPGDLSVGGVLAINGHGTSVPADGETRAPGHSYGTLSNLILSLTAVVWDAATDGYVLRTFDRADPECAALLTHVGRTFVTEVTLRVGANQNLRCVSRVDIPAAELFAAPGTGGRTLTSFVAAAGRVEAIWFAFTDNPWLKVWSVSPTRPLTSRPVLTPYNYVFSDNVPEPVSELAEQLLGGAWELTPTFGQVQYTTAAAGLTGTLATDLWGPSKNLLLYVKPTTLRETANGYAVHTSRGSVQRVVHEFARFYQRQLAAYQSRGEFPVTGQVEIRVAGVDRAADVGVPGAQPPALSAARPRADHPEWDCVVWFDVLTFPTAPRAHAFYREMENFFFGTYTGSYAGCRVEWSKGWGYTDAAAWADPTMLTRTVPDSYRQAPDPTWDRAVEQLNGHDPHRVFSNAFLDVLLPTTS
ncbi:cholesterol oxidase substrate-binding domain-containing protein [Micromonospora sp. WMMD1102]|uniref:cholesterol oxidase substrate-binding domain-containing protein n=1 Tax=Micromonospora sp. WMMD1102 TaxID=3016105 RepID=UPI00241545A7|nr:cholesterol oxidase substrate-binding domain-containing protein [Micromonospora sp. WMMD1102]MDG4787274.1 cholesterol oxidase substrate-binding domain-containing protein [Micromonospora sp. WMMD1102]